MDIFLKKKKKTEKAWKNYKLSKIEFLISKYPWKFCRYIFRPITSISKKFVFVYYSIKFRVRIYSVACAYQTLGTIAVIIIKRNYLFLEHFHWKRFKRSNGKRTKMLWFVKKKYYKMNGCCKFTSGTSRVNPESTEDVSIKFNAKM